jgi:hypothetical protein
VAVVDVGMVFPFAMVSVIHRINERAARIRTAGPRKSDGSRAARVAGEKPPRRNRWSGLSFVVAGFGVGRDGWAGHDNPRRAQRSRPTRTSFPATDLVNPL